MTSVETPTLPVARADSAAPERPSVVYAPIVLEGVSWGVYEQLRDQTDRAGQRLYLTYDRGKLEIMAPSPFHERSKMMLGSFITILRMELRIPIASFGSTTFRREDLKRGLEPDQCYYVQHEPQMGEKTSIDLAK